MAILDALPERQGRRRPRSAPRLADGERRALLPVASARRPGRAADVRAPCGHVAGVLRAHRPCASACTRRPPTTIVDGCRWTSSSTSRHRPRRSSTRPGSTACASSPARGIRVWGARTLSARGGVDLRQRAAALPDERARAGSSSPCRTLAFEPSDRRLWQRITQRASRVPRRALHGRGALRAATPAEAFFVNATRRPTRPRSREPGRVVTDIGLARHVAERVHRRAHHPRRRRRVAIDRPQPIHLTRRETFRYGAPAIGGPVPRLQLHRRDRRLSRAPGSASARARQLEPDPIEYREGTDGADHAQASRPHQVRRTSR